MLFSFTAANATKKEIIAYVIFENNTGKTFDYGELVIPEIQTKIKVNTTENFKITLPFKGKYHFQFLTNQFSVYIFQPKKITNKKNKIIIRLTHKSNTNFEDKSKNYSFILNKQNKSKIIEQLLLTGDLNFIIHRIDNVFPDEYIKFKDMYGIGVLKKNCLTNPLDYEQARKNNRLISNYLNLIYGKSWLKKLKSKPLGVE
ncbi:hypothetical protein AW14_09865 [Siansivirga zeaxanthinifaciens CC-SAMT-1]|uniref:DUF4369 domain-containing protein n=2 Tax=Siansivirga TaxID=1204360 RepID=A0A0C5W9S0_9FLAO|nr:hypothetical protein AW14_09865 [Siansivirga zeaxanthinifaciens CC-SAMT-1]